MGRQAMLSPRSTDEGRRITLDDAFTSEIAAQRANRRELAGRRRARIAALVQVAEERADLLVVEVRRQQFGPATSRGCGDERDELGEIGFVGAHRVQRGVVVESQVFEKGFDLLLHRIVIHERHPWRAPPVPPAR